LEKNIRMTDYRKWDQIAASMGDSDGEQDEDETTETDVKRTFSDKQPLHNAESTDAPGFAELKQHCVKLLAAKTNIER
jgi:hypothetical protein